MREILHIFRKDVRRHWPEILISLLFLGLYVWVTLRSPWRTGTAMLTGASLWPLLAFSLEWIPPLMVLFWVFLTVRLVQGEPLVGDRQWWVTKPYEWWKLLAAKELFLVAVISLPLFFVQVYFLSHAGFPVLPNLVRILYMQVTLGLILFLPSIALGSLTKNLWQAVLAVVLAFVVIVGATNLLQRVPSSGMSSSIDEAQSVATGLLMLASFVGAVTWQFARRKTWRSRGVLLAGPVLLGSLAALIPYARFVERKYAIAASALPQFTPGIVHPKAKKRDNRWDFLSEVYLSIPVSVSGIAPGHMVRLDGMRVFLEIPANPTWDPGWKPQRTNLWAENQQTKLTFSMKREDFERIKPQQLRLQLELALTEFQEGDVRDLALKEGKFPDELLGICHLVVQNPSAIECERPFHAPGLMVTFEPSLAKCEISEDDKRIVESRVSHAWLPPGDDDSVSSPLNPVVDYFISLYSGEFRWSLDEGAQPIVKRVYLCPGAGVRLASPVEKNQWRVQLKMENVRLEDLAFQRD